MGGLGGGSHGLGRSGLRRGIYAYGLDGRDRNRVWRKVEVGLVEQQSGEASEGLAGGRGVWRLRAQSLVESVEEWLASNEAATDQAIRDLDGRAESAAPTQNPAELAVLVSATRTSAVLWRRRRKVGV